MAVELNTRRIGNFSSQDNLSGKYGARDGLYRLAVLGTEPWTAAVCGGSTARVIGVIQNTPEQGTAIALALGDVLPVRTGATFAANTLVMSDSQGRVIPFVAGSGNVDVGTALDASTGPDQAVSVMMSINFSGNFVSGSAPNGAPSQSTVAATGVTLDQSSFTVSVGGNRKLTATVAPASASNQTVNWTTSDATIATVSNTGMVTGVKVGTATITATTADGGFTATATATVSS